MRFTATAAAAAILDWLPAVAGDRSGSRTTTTTALMAASALPAEARMGSAGYPLAPPR